MKLKINMLKSTLVHEAATLVGGNAVGQGIALLAYLLLTRIFSPSDFALYNIFLSHIEVLVILSTLKYEQSIVVAHDDHEGSATAHLALTLNTFFSLLLLAVASLLLLTHTLPGDMDQLGWLVLLIPPMVYFTGTSRIYTSLFNRVRRYRDIAASTIALPVAGSALKVLFGLLGMMRSGLPLGNVLGQAAANLVFRLKMRKLGLPKVSTADMKAAAFRHLNFARYVATKDFINTFSANLPFLWLAAYFDKTEVGLFALAMTFTMRPANLLNNAFEKVMYARSAEAVRCGQPLGRMVWRFLAWLYAAALPLCVLAWFVAEPLFTFFFSGRWSGCGVYVQALLPWMLVSLSSTSLMFISNLFGTQRIDFFFMMAQLGLRVGAIAIGIAADSFLLAIRLYATAGTLVAVSLLVWYLWQVRRHDKKTRQLV